MKLIIDRFEGDYAVCEKEDKTIIDIKKDHLPPSAKVGDVILYENGIYSIDEDTTQQRKQRIEKLMDDLWD